MIFTLNFLINTRSEFKEFHPTWIMSGGQDWMLIDTRIDRGWKELWRRIEMPRICLQLACSKNHLSGWSLDRVCFDDKDSLLWTEFITIDQSIKLNWIVFPSDTHRRRVVLVRCYYYLIPRTANRFVSAEYRDLNRKFNYTCNFEVVN